MKETEFRTYWLVDGLKINSYEIMRKRVLAGETAIEVTAAQQQVAYNDRKRRERENAALDEKIRQAAAQRAYEQSATGKVEAARRTALEHQGGVVSLHVNAIDELDVFGPDCTNALK